MSQRTRDLIRSISLANLVYLWAWERVLPLGSSALYYRGSAPTRTQLCVTAALVLLASALLFLAATLLRRARRPWAVWAGRAGVVFLFCIVANAVRIIWFPNLSNWAHHLVPNPSVLAAATAAGIAAVVVLASRWTRYLLVAVSVLSPLAIFTFGRAFYACLVPQSGDFSVSGPASVKLDHGSGSVRVIWIIFDELDQRLAIDQPPKGLQLPELKRLRNQSVSASHAYPPSSATLLSIPALTTGRLVERAQPLDTKRLLLTFQGGSGLGEWTAQPTVFRVAFQDGFRLGVAGWYHPYCRLFGGYLERCVARESPFTSIVRTEWEDVAKDQAVEPFVGLGYFPFGAPPLVRDHGDDLRKLLPAAISMAQDESLDLVYLHLPIPHPPFIYDRSRDDIGIEPQAPAGYLDNLILVDRTLGEIRHALEAEGVWDSTVMLVSADHSWRRSASLDGIRDYRVPFLLKLPGQVAGQDYDLPFNTILTRDLLLALLHGKIGTAADACHWLDTHASQAPLAPVGVSIRDLRIGDGFRNRTP